MTEKLLTGTLSLNTNKKCVTCIVGKRSSILLIFPFISIFLYHPWYIGICNLIQMLCVTCIVGKRSSILLILPFISFFLYHPWYIGICNLIQMLCVTCIVGKRSSILLILPFISIFLYHPWYIGICNLIQMVCVTCIVEKRSSILLILPFISIFLSPIFRYNKSFITFLRDGEAFKAETWYTNRQWVDVLWLLVLIHFFISSFCFLSNSQNCHSFFRNCVAYKVET